MNRSLILVSSAILVIVSGVYLFKDELVTSSKGTSVSSIRLTEVELNLNSPVDASVLMNLMEVYGDNSCPKITIRRLDMKGNNQVTIQPIFSWLNEFKSGFFPLTKADLEGDIAQFKGSGLNGDVQRLIGTKQSSAAVCDYSWVQANYSFKKEELNGKNLTAYVNRAVAEGKNKVVFKVLSCPKVVVPPPPPPKDRDRDGFVDARDPCPDNAGRFEGCPDTDGDGFPDHKDDCDDVPGKNKGCPPIARVEMNLDGDGKTLYFKGGKIGSENYKIQFEDFKSGKRRRSAKHTLPIGQSILSISKAKLGQLVTSPKIANSDYPPKKSNTRLQPFTVIVFDNRGKVALSQEIWLDCGALTKN
jgi:hypothetical protein